ncbi:MAG: putative transrane anti-sigma factor [Myxococcales bacterium]|nr:putative transrane anti-sigma factor [Myxococcales bacterium]
MSDPAEIDEAIIAKVSDYLDGLLAGAERDEVANKIADEAQWKRAHEEMLETRKFLSGMRKARAPESFAQDVTATIHKRSAGRFFARRTFGDRVPFGALMIVAVLGLAVLGYFMWSSQTGSLKQDRDRGGEHHGSAVIVPPP